MKLFDVKKNKLLGICLFGIMCVSIVMLYTAVSIWDFAKTDQIQKADVIIVLGAGVNGKEPSPVFAERLNHGVWLYNNGYANKLLVTGGMGKDSTEPEAEVAKRYLVNKGISGEDILPEKTSRYTHENLKNAKMLMDENSFSTAIVVSDPLHMKRAMIVARDYGITAYSSPTPTTRYIGIKSRLSFLLRETVCYIGYMVFRIFVFLRC